MNIDTIDDLREAMKGLNIWRLTSSYDDGEEEYGVEYTVGLFLSKAEAEACAHRLHLCSYGIGVFTFGDIIVREDRNIITNRIVEEGQD